MALAHTILVVLNEDPQSGYDLAKCFTDRGKSPVSCFWQASQQQIYRELNRLEKEGWVEVDLIIQEGRPNKKIYHVTPTGLEMLKEWMLEPTEPTAIREDLGIKLLAASLVDRNIIVQEIQRRQRIHTTFLNLYYDLKAGYQAQDSLSPFHQFSYIMLQRGIRYESEWIAWCDEALVMLADIPEDPADLTNQAQSSQTPNTQSESSHAQSTAKT